MNTGPLKLTLAALLLVTATLQADEAEKYAANPDNYQAFLAYYRKTANEVNNLIRFRKYEQAKKAIAKGEEFLKTIKPTDAKGKSYLRQAKSTFTGFRSRVLSREVTFKELLSKIEGNADDQQSLSTLNIKIMYELGTLARYQPKSAKTQLDNIAKVLDAATPKEKNATRSLALVKGTVKRYQDTATLSAMPLKEIAEKIKATDDQLFRSNAVSIYVNRVSREISSLARRDPDAADAKYQAAKKLVEEHGGARATNRYGRTFTSIERSIKSARKLAALIGKDAMPLGDVAWANGEAISDKDLKGKVVLLDFWAVWCGPCIATFPHLREWREKYSDKGLEIIGVTRYYNYSWNETTNRASRSTEPVSADDEHKMLAAFAKHHRLGHRFAITKKDSNNKFQDYYGVSGIPEAVLIDKKGKVRMVRIGSGPQNAKDLHDMIEKLLAE